MAIVCTSSAYETEIKNLSAAMADKIAGANKTKAAVVDFTDLQGDVTELGRFIAEEFSVAIAGSGKGFSVVDRTHLKSIIKENKLSSTGMIDPETARKLGKIAGVEALVTGTLTPFGDSVRISVKILDTASAEVIEAKTGNIAKTQAIEELLARGIASGSIASGSTKPAPKRKTGKVIETKVAEGFTFELRECKRSGKNVTCHFIITSNGQDRKLQRYGRGSRIFDDLGNEYRSDYAQLGSLEGTLYNHDISNDLIAEIPTKASINFPEVSANAGSIALLDVHCRKFNVQFRKVPFSE